MNANNTVAIVGSGIVGTTIAYFLSQKGWKVDIFEKGPDYPFPHIEQFTERIFYLYNNPKYRLPEDLKNHTISGDYQHSFEKEREMVVGGSGTTWTGLTLRMTPADFKTKSLYDYGEDWPFTYDEIEPYYCQAEQFLGVSGTDADNPFAPRRSLPYPLPEFELSYDDLLLAERLQKHDLVLHTTPQAINSRAYDGRDACENFGTCGICPIGARYSPNHHLQQALATGNCKLYKNVSVRRIILDKSGKARALVYQPNDSRIEKEQASDIIIITASAVESVRLLLLSKDHRHPDGVGNVGGLVGKNMTFHHLWHGRLKYKEKLYPGRIGPMTGQCHQFLNPPYRGKHGGIKVEFASTPGLRKKITKWGNQAEILHELRPKLYSRGMIMHSESLPDPQKYVTLSQKRDRFGDPLAHIQYESCDFDYQTYKFAEELFELFATATNAEKVRFDSMNQFESGAHHMGGCRMGLSPQDSVVNQYGKIHECPNLFVVGGSNFPGTSGAVNPTLTMVALAIRSAEYIMDR